LNIKLFLSLCMWIKKPTEMWVDNALLIWSSSDYQ
jgi:hypothetical protein